MIDRYLCLHEVPKSELQLLGITCLFMACKYQEIYPPRMSKYVHVTDNSVTKDQMIRKESHVLQSFSF